MTDDKIQAAALAAGFTLKPQPDGSQALHPHVFEFARAMLAAGQQEAQEEIARLHQELAQRVWRSPGSALCRQSESGA